VHASPSLRLKCLAEFVGNKQRHDQIHDENEFDQQGFLWALANAITSVPPVTATVHDEQRINTLREPPNYSK